MDYSKFSGQDIRNKLRGKDLGSVFNQQARENLGSQSSMGAKSRLSSELAGKSLSQRKAIYKKLGMGGGQINRLENMIVGERKLTTMEMKQIKKNEEAKKQRNVFASKRSAEESGGASSYGASGYEESTGSFAGGSVSTRTRVSMVGRGEENTGTALGGARGGGFAQGGAGSSKSPFAKSTGATRGGFAGGASKMNKPLGSTTPKIGGGRPLGF